MNNTFRRWGVFLLLSFLFFSPYQNILFADDESDENKLNKKYLSNFVNDFGSVVASPKDWDKKDLGNLAFVLGTGVFIYLIDQDIHQQFEGNSSDTSDSATRLVTSFGNGGVLAGLIAAMYVGGEISNNDSLRKTALLSLESLLTSGIVVRGMKILIGRARPETDGTSSTFHPLTLRSSFNSFPSGHSAAAFSVATVIAAQSKNMNIDILVYGLATFVAVSRIYNNRHWASDAFVGSSIGYLVGKKICALDRNRKSNKVQLNFQFTPQRKALTVSIFF